MSYEIKDYPNDDDVLAVETERLIVSWHPLPDTGICDGRVLFVARSKDDQPEVIAHATWAAGFNYIDWLEVNERERRQGYGSEFRAAIVHMIGCQPCTYGATEAGCKFLRANGIDADGIDKENQEVKHG